MLPYFIFKGIDSRDYLIVDKLPSIFKPAKDIRRIEIEGRDGFLTQDNGSYRSIIKSVECWIKDLSQIDYICSWLTGGGDVLFSNEPDKKYKATIINQIDFNKIVLQYHKFIIQLDCQPHKHDVDNNPIILTAASVILNPGAASKPVIKIYGAGNIDLTINSAVIHITSVVDYVTIDGELMDCYKDTVLKNNNMNGEFPVLVSGSNTISWTGIVTKVEVVPNRRWL